MSVPTELHMDTSLMTGEMRGAEEIREVGDISDVEIRGEVDTKGEEEIRGDLDMRGDDVEMSEVGGGEDTREVPTGESLVPAVLLLGDSSEEIPAC